jgi:hypothetical protein
MKKNEDTAKNLVFPLSLLEIAIKLLTAPNNIDKKPIKAISSLKPGII